MGVILCNFCLISDVPEPLRPDAVQCALLLLPEEHLEALHSLLIFLFEVSCSHICLYLQQIFVGFFVIGRWSNDLRKGADSN